MRQKIKFEMMKKFQKLSRTIKYLSLSNLFLDGKYEKNKKKFSEYHKPFKSYKNSKKLKNSYSRNFDFEAFEGFKIFLNNY